MKAASPLEEHLGDVLAEYAERLPVHPDLARLHAELDAAATRRPVRPPQHRLLTASAAAGILALVGAGAVVWATGGEAEHEAPIVEVTDAVPDTTGATTAVTHSPTTVARVATTTATTVPTTAAPTTPVAPPSGQVATPDSHAPAVAPSPAAPPAAVTHPAPTPSSSPTTAGRQLAPARPRHRSAPPTAPPAPTTPATPPPTAAPAPTAPPTTVAPPTHPPATHPPGTAPPRGPVTFTAHAAFGFCADDPPFDVYSGTATPGTTIEISSPYGSTTTTADSDGTWHKRLVFEGAPKNETFLVTVSSPQGTVTFEFTHTG